MWLELIRVPVGATLEGRPPRACERVPLEATDFVVGPAEADLHVPDAVATFRLRAVGAGLRLEGPGREETFGRRATVWTGPGGELVVRRVDSPDEISWPTLPVCVAAKRASVHLASLDVLRDGLLEAEHPLGAHLERARSLAGAAPAEDWLGELPWLLEDGSVDVHWESGLAVALTVRTNLELLPQLAPLAVLHLTRSLDVVLSHRGDALESLHSALARAAFPWLERLTVHNVPRGRGERWERRLGRQPGRQLSELRINEETPLGLLEPGATPRPLPTDPGQRFVVWRGEPHGPVQRAEGAIVCLPSLCPSLVVQHPAEFTLNGIPRRTAPGRATVLPLVANDALEYRAWRGEIVSLRP